MKVSTTLLAGLVAAALVTACGQSDKGAMGDPAAAQVATSHQTGCPLEGEPLDTAMLYVEYNATDNDTGVHGLVGGQARWVTCIWDPTGELILVADPLAQLDNLGMADLFFESREPANDELSQQEILAGFPEGDYLIGGTDFEGNARVGVARFTHDIPAAPEITTPLLAEDEGSVADTIPITDLVVEWNGVGATTAGTPVELTAYQVIVTKVDHDDPDGNSRPIFDVHVGPEARSLRVSDGFLEPGTLYELEVLAIESSGNQTIALGFFATE